MSTAWAKSKPGFLARWIGLSFMGWLLGMFCVFWAGDLQSSYWVEIYSYSPLLETLTSMAAWLPLGIVIGAMQSIELRHWKTNPISWILASGFGWWIPVTAGYLWFESGLYWAVSLFPLLGILITGLSIGAFQVYALGISFSKRKILLISNVLGFGVLACYLTLVFPTETFILDWIALLFVGTITASLPSGLSLLLLFEGQEQRPKFPASEEFGDIQNAG